jgi:hypothetical protein
MDLVSVLVSFLAPFVPYLFKAGEGAAEEAGKKFGAAAWEKAKALWGTLWPKVEEKPAAQEAVQDVASNPEDEDAQAALRQQVKKLLVEDSGLAQEIAEMVKAGAQAGVIAIASGERAVALGGDIVGSTVTISTGDKKDS